MKKEISKNVYQTYDYIVKAPTAKENKAKPQKTNCSASCAGGKRS